MILAIFMASTVLAAVPETLTRVVDGQWTLRLTKESLRGSHFEVKVQNSSGGYDSYDHGEVRTCLDVIDAMRVLRNTHAEVDGAPPACGK